MATTLPIKNKKDLATLKNYYLTKKTNLRNYALIVTGINTALRIGDLLQLTWEDVYDFERNAYHQHIMLRESKTGKRNIIALNQNAIEGLAKYKASLSSLQPTHYIFCGRHPEAPLSRIQVYRIIKQAAEALEMPENISCHSMRKTFGYHAWVAGANSVVLMQIYNHSSFQITKRYLGIMQEDKDKIYLQINL